MGLTVSSAGFGLSEDVEREGRVGVQGIGLLPPLNGFVLLWRVVLIRTSTVLPSSP